MKKVFTLLCIFMASCLIVSTLMGCNKTTILPDGALPEGVKEFVRQHFNGVGIQQSKKERELNETIYRINLNQGYELIFDDTESIQYIKGVKAIPTSVFLDPIRHKIDSTLAPAYAIEWDKEYNSNKDQLILLNTKKKLFYTVNGDFIREE